MIAKAFKTGGDINPTVLLEKKCIKKLKGKVPAVKILSGKAPFSIKIKVSNCLVSASANDAIIKAGGEVVVEVK